jgi:spore germination protein KC
MRAGRILAVCLITLLLSGCWSRRELTEVSFAGVLGLDWEDDQYLVTVDILSPRPAGGETGAGTRDQRIWTISERAPSVDQAFAKLDQVLSRALTLTHIRSIAFGEELARRGIGPAMDSLMRSVEIRPTAWVSVTTGRAADLLKARPQQELAVSDSPMGYQDAATRRSSVTPARRLTEVANMLQEEGIELTLPLFRPAPTPPPKEEGALAAHPEAETEIIYGGVGVFRGDKMVDWLSPAATRGLLMAQKRAVHGAVLAPCKDPAERILYRLRSTRGQVSAAVVQGKVRGRIDLKVVADVNEMTCSEEMVPNGDLRLLEARLKEELAEQVESALAVTRETGADVFGFGQALFRSTPVEFKRREQNWASTLQSLPVAVQIQTQVPRLGMINRTYRWNPTKEP